MSSIRKALEFYAAPDVYKMKPHGYDLHADIEDDRGARAREALATLEHAEVMWRVRYGDGLVSDLTYTRAAAQSAAQYFAESSGAPYTIERVLVIREDLE